MEWTALPVGLVFASLATMVGIGGGILWTPYLIFVLGLSPAEAVLTSLIVQVAGMGSGGLTVAVQNKTDPRVSLILAGAAFPGVAAGVWLSTVVPQQCVVFLLGVACLATALVFVAAREDLGDAPVRKVPLRSIVPYLWPVPLLSTLTGLLSVGVGDFLVPILRNRLNMRMDAAIGACLILMAMNAAVASALHIAGGETFSGRLVFIAALGVIAGGQIGPRIARRIPDQTLKEIFIYGLSLVGIHIVFNAF
ncbi:MAG: sulfite exporter TauE/SafE family protein [Desulfomonilaceae bacterium]|nr:sulfite exporter TauE/SafE family protein [Desulfomonilaceae bacterium]